MELVYSLLHHFVTCIVLVNLCLQSCTAHNTPTEQKDRQLTQAIFPLAYHQAKDYTKFLSQQGHLVTFYQEGTQLRAEVEEKPDHGFSQLHHLPVSIEQGKSIDQVMNAAIDQSKSLIHVYLPISKQPGFVYVGNVDLMGVSQTGKDKGKEKVTEDELQEKSNGTAQATTNSLANKQIVFEKEHQVTTSHPLLHMAARNGDLATARSLLLIGSDINARDQLGCTPLHRAASKGHMEILKLLLEQGANPYAAEYNGMAALHFASLHGHLQAVNLLLQRTDVNVQDKDGYSPLFLATRSENIPIIEALINRGANVNARNKLGNTPLYEAVRRANLAMVKLLYNKGADLDVQNIYGWAPLHLAVGGCKEIVNYLVARGADINIKNNDGLTPIDLAIQDRLL
jgi:ankyrin repeat protein